MPRVIRTSATRNAGRGVEFFSNQMGLLVKAQNVALATSGSAKDLVKIDLNLDYPGSGLWLPTSITVRARAASSTLALATIRLFTAAAGGGNAICAATALTSLTGTANQFQEIAVTAGSVLQTSTAVWVRQTVDSGNAGNVDIMVGFRDFSDYDKTYHTVL